MADSRRGLSISSYAVIMVVPGGGGVRGIRIVHVSRIPARACGRGSDGARGGQGRAAAGHGSMLRESEIADRFAEWEGRSASSWTCHGTTPTGAATGCSTTACCRTM